VEDSASEFMTAVVGCGCMAAYGGGGALLTLLGQLGHSAEHDHLIQPTQTLMSTVNSATAVLVKPREAAWRGAVHIGPHEGAAFWGHVPQGTCSTSRQCRHCKVPQQVLSHLCEYSVSCLCSVAARAQCVPGAACSKAKSMRYSTSRRTFSVCAMPRLFRMVTLPLG